ncbi:MAG: hypothetical protein JSR48_14210 [Verrucomicrobia bacterium]|nr:hypothetical protein [Verrucomicrobiota bacterium]
MRRLFPISALRIFGRSKLGGSDWLGRPFRKTIDVAAGTVQTRWDHLPTVRFGAGFRAPGGAAP